MVKPSQAPVVATESISKQFDDLLALDRVSIEFHAGRVHALLGENGAGKSTLCNVLAGLYRSDGGRVLVDGMPAALTTPADAVAQGIGMVHQHFHLVRRMTVAENLALGDPGVPRFTTARELEARAFTMLTDLGFDLDPSKLVADLSVGEQQRVEIARVLSRGARLLILDEPTAVLAGEEVRQLFEAVRGLTGGGHAVVFVSHKLNEVMEISDRISVLRRGQLVLETTPNDTTTEELARVMTGSAYQSSAGPRPGGGSPTSVLRLNGVSVTSDRGFPALRDVGLSVNAGEIVGIAGVSGNGQSELAEVTTGVRKPSSGTVYVGSENLTGCGPPAFVRAGVGYIPEDRLAAGLVGSASVGQNAILRTVRLPGFAGRWLLTAYQMDAYAQDLVGRARVDTPGLHVPVANLSGGNQQRLVAQREADSASTVLVASQPTRGLDVLAAGQVHETLRELAVAGVGILVISEELEELFDIAHRIIVMYGGEIVGEFNRAEADAGLIGMLMGGATAMEKVTER